MEGYFFRVVEQNKEAEKVQLSSSESVRSVRSGDNATSLPPNQAAWLPVARQVLGGEFDGADKSTAGSLLTGLRSINHPACRRALDKLRAAAP
jgi:hypothetical protein